MSRPSSFWTRIILVSGVLGLTGHGAVWLRSVDRLRGLMEEQAGALRDRGWRVELGPVRWGGWPGRASVEIGPVSIATDGFAWRAESVVADTALFRPGPVVMRSAGHRVRLGLYPEMVVTAREAIIEPRADGVVLTGVGVHIADVIEAEALQARLGPATLAMTARRIRLPDAPGARSPAIDSLELRAVLTRPIPSAAGLRTAVAAWRDAGGTVDVPEFALAGAGMRASGRIGLWLDSALQPNFDGMLHVTGYAAGLDSLVTRGNLPGQAAVAAKAVLGLLAAPSPDGGVDVAVRMRDDVLVIAQFPLLRMPRLEWPGPASVP